MTTTNADAAWTEALPDMLNAVRKAASSYGDPATNRVLAEEARVAEAEFSRMARLADLYIAEHKGDPK